MTEEQKPKTEKLPMDFMMNESMNQQLITLNKNHIPKGSGDATAEVGGSIPSTKENNLNKKGGKKMQLPMQMGPPQESSWEDHRDTLKIQIANSEKSLLMARAQLKEAESHIKEE